MIRLKIEGNRKLTGTIKVSGAKNSAVALVPASLLADDKVTIDNIRRILSSFFSWLEDEDYILKSPVRRIHRIKTSSNIKETYSDED